jgi:hypothetical protein
MSLLGKFYYKFKNYREDVKRKSCINSNIQNFITYYTGSEDPEIIQMLKYYKSGKDRPFPYPYIDKYFGRDIDVLNDAANGIHYVFHNGNKLYFPGELDVTSIIKMYNGLCAEQDRESPHCYTHPDFLVSQEDVLIDVGCADALFSLNHVEHAKKVFLFEAEERWMKPLSASFKPWLSKTEIIKGWVSDKKEGDFITLDSIFDAQEIIKNCFIKIDVEGHEEEVLRGASNLLNNKNVKIKLAIATYHKQEDFDSLNNILKGLCFNTMATDGYIFLTGDNNLKPPYLRKCLIRAKNF